MRVNIRTRVASVNIAFSSSRNAAFIGRKMLQYTTLFTKLYHCTLSEKNPSSYIVRRPCWCLNTLCGSETTLKPDFSTKSIVDTLQTCVAIANE